MSRPRRVRLDDLLVDRGFFATRDEAARACFAGDVTSPAMALTTPSQAVPSDIELNVRQLPRFVSRGGEKLAGALADLGLPVGGLRCIDAGASTGGFTDCLLQAGAASVCAVDVGYGQFDYGLRCDDRVTLFERTNIKKVGAADIGGPFDLLVADLSFISLGALLPVLHGFICEGGRMLVLVKPQFEADRASVGEGGIVQSAATHESVLAEVVGGMVAEGLFVEGLVASRVTGKKSGNIEFFICARDSADAPGVDDSIDIASTVMRAHRNQGELA